MEAPAPIKTLATVGNAGDVIINAFLTVFLLFHSFGPQPPPYPLVFPSCSLYIPIMRCLSVQNKKGGENSVKLGYYGNVETEQRMGGRGCSSLKPVSVRGSDSTERERPVRITTPQKHICNSSWSSRSPRQRV